MEILIILLLAVFCFLFPLSSGSLAAEHRVSKGETLSEIILRYSSLFPGKRLYGRNGRIAHVLKLNPEISNPNFILPNQTIVLLSEQNSLENTPQVEVPVESSTEDPKEDSISGPEEIPHDESVSDESLEPSQPGEKIGKLSAQMGLKHIRVNQKGALGVGETQGTFPNIVLSAETPMGPLTYSMQFETYVYEYEIKNSADSRRMYSLDFNVGYNSFLFGVNGEQLPLFRNNAGSLEMVRESLINLSLGYEKIIPLNELLSSQLKLRAFINVPVTSWTEEKEIKTSSISGFGGYGRAVYSRHFYSYDSKDFTFDWTNQLGFQKFSQDTTWSVSKGNVNSEIISASSSIGLSLSF